MPKKQCPFKAAGVKYIDYKNVAAFNRYISSYGKIVPRYYTNVSLKYQRMLSRAVKNARYMGLVPYIK